MSATNISLPDALKSFVDKQVKERGYGTRNIPAWMQAPDQDNVQPSTVEAYRDVLTVEQEILTVRPCAAYMKFDFAGAGAAPGIIECPMRQCFWRGNSFLMSSLSWQPKAQGLPVAAGTSAG